MQGAWTGRNKNSMVMGWDGAQMRRDNDFQKLGFPDEKAYLTARDIPDSTWYKMVRIAEAFEYASEEDFFSMKIENADRLSYLEVKHRYDPTLMTAARYEKTGVFSDRVAVFKAVKAGLTPGEAQVTQKFHLTQSQRTAVLGGLKEWMRNHGLKNEGEALELLIAEYVGRPTLVAAYKDSIDILQSTLKNCHNPEMRESLEQVLTRMQVTFQVVVEGKSMLQAYEAVMEEAAV